MYCGIIMGHFAVLIILTIVHMNRRLDNLTADELSRNRLDSHWPLGVDDSELLFDGWLQAGIL